MTQPVDCGPLAACDDCALLITLDETHEGHRERFTARQATHRESDHLVIQGERTELATTLCDGCGTTTAGGRWAMVALEPDPHEHTYRRDISDWWCVDCETVTDYCQQINPH